MTRLYLISFIICYNATQIISQDFTTTSIMGTTYQMTSADYDDDGDMDVFGLSFRSQGTALNYYTNLNDPGSISFNLETKAEMTDAIGIPLTLDVDNDGDMDILYGTATRGTMIMINNGLGNFDESPLLNSTAYDFREGDFDGDGDLDIIAISAIEDNATVFLKESNSNYTKHIVVSDLNALWDFEAADFDGDGDYDFVIGSNDSQKDAIVYYENSGNGFDFISKVLQDNTRGRLIDIVKGDLDNDGDMDLGMVSNNRAGIWINMGNNNFAFQNLTSSAFDHINFLDFDGNEVLDVLLTSNSGMIWFQNNSQDPLGYEEREFSGFQGIFSSVGADFDLDGDIDLFTSRVGNVIFQNNFPQNPPSSLKELDPSLYSIFPNPTTDYITLRSNDGADLSFVLRDMQGQQIRSGAAGTIPLQDLSAGIYHLEIIDTESGDRRVEKIVKQ